MLESRLEDDQTVDVVQATGSFWVHRPRLISQPNPLHQSTDLAVHARFYRPLLDGVFEFFVFSPTTAICIDSPTRLGTGSSKRLRVRR